MTKDVLVSVAGLQADVNGMENCDEEPIEVLSAGTYYFKDGKHFIFFEEVVEGVPGVTKTQIRLSGSDSLEVRKKGIANVNMVFEKNKNNRCFYQTPFGQINLGIFTKDIWVEESEDNIDIRADYDMDVDYEPLAKCSIRINVKSKDSKDFSIHEKMIF